MLKLGAIVAGLSLLTSAALAQNEATTVARVEILVGGKTLVVKSLKGEAKIRANKVLRKATGTIVLEATKGELKLRADEVRYDKAGYVTLSGKASISVQQGEQTLIQITADEAVVEAGQAEQK